MAAGLKTRRPFSLFRDAGKLEPLADFALAESISADEVQILDAIAKAETRQYRFPPRLEHEFQQHMRLASRTARLSVTLLTLAMFVSAPLWSPLLNFTTPETHILMLFVELAVMGPLFALLTFTILRWPAAEGTEWLMVAVFIAEAACIEVVRYYSEIAELIIPPSIGIAVPVAVMTLTRLSVGRCLIMVATYFTVMLGIQYAAQGYMTARDSGTWMFEIILLLVVFLSTVWNRLSFRRQWAARVLLSLMAYRDSLTGLPNRRAFEEHYERASRALTRGRTQRLLFALIDLDHFKKINDRYGHEYGDGVLAEVGLVLAHSARRSMDMSARLGGEEFALLLYGCELEAARKRMAELVAAFEALGIEHQDNAGGLVTCSVGAVIVSPTQALSDAYRAADALLYQAKRAGRNQFRIEDISQSAEADGEGEAIGNPT